MRAGALSCGLAAALIAVLASATANASVTIGSNLAATPSGGVVGNLMLANASLPTTAPGGLFAPQNGVVVYWAVRSSAPSNTNNTVRLRILNGNTATAASPARVAPAGAGITGYAERIPISTGERIGVEFGSTMGPVSISIIGSVVGASVHSWGPPLAAGESRVPTNTSPNFELLVQATIEDDADVDGFGDETQDGCVGVAGTLGGCPPPPSVPETEITSAPAKKIKKPKASFSFSSPSAGASFECALDKLGFSDCASPKKLKKLTDGKHRFRVRAVSAEGLIDRSPAEQGFKVQVPSK